MPSVWNQFRVRKGGAGGPSVPGSSSVLWAAFSSACRVVADCLSASLAPGRGLGEAASCGRTRDLRASGSSPGKPGPPSRGRIGHALKLSPQSSWWPLGFFMESAFGQST